MFFKEQFELILLARVFFRSLGELKVDSIEVFLVLRPWIMTLSRLYLYDTDITSQRPNLAAYIGKPHKDAQRDRIHDYTVRVNVLFATLQVG